MSNIELVDLGLGPYVHSPTSQRLPVYTRGNAGEVWPQVAYPLSVSVANDTASKAYRSAALSSGLLRERDLIAGDADFGGCYGGYMYINLSFSRLIAIRAPGTTIEENDAIFLGSEGIAPPHVPHRDDKNLLCTLRGMRFAWGVLRTEGLPELEDDKAEVERLLADLSDPTTCTDAELIARLDAFQDIVVGLFKRHLIVTGNAGAMLSGLSSVCEKSLGDRAVALTMLGGIGDVESAGPSFTLWELGRMVAADPWLSEQFDAGMNGLWQRLGANERGAGFVAQYERFLDENGSRGPNEWEPACDTWGTAPEMALALVDRMRVADERQAPGRRAAVLGDKREQAIADALTNLKGPNRWLFKRLVRSATLFSQGRERSKTTVIRALHATRLSNRELACRVAERSGGQPDDLYFVLRSELEAFVEDPAAFRDIVTQRRATREALSERVPPFVFEGEMPRADTWPLRAPAGSASLMAVGDVLEGLGGCPGVAEGRARVVTDPSDPGDLGPGDVLLAPLTDPAWTPLFVPSEAVVVDVGGQMSHAVIVARELGMPCVVAATDATGRIPNGARVRVDGSAGTVTVLELP